jgi:hypothetical protein
MMIMVDHDDCVNTVWLILSAVPKTPHCPFPLIKCHSNLLVFEFNFSTKKKNVFRTFWTCLNQNRNVWNSPRFPQAKHLFNPFRTSNSSNMFMHYRDFESIRIDFEFRKLCVPSGFFSGAETEFRADLANKILYEIVCGFGLRKSK